MTWVKWNIASFHLETVLVSVQDRCVVCTRHTIGSEIVLDALHCTLGDKAQLEDRFGLFGDRLILTQDRCTVCIERTIGSEIVLDRLDGTPR